MLGPALRTALEVFQMGMPSVRSIPLIYRLYVEFPHLGIHSRACWVLRNGDGKCVNATLANRKSDIGNYDFYSIVIFHLHRSSRLVSSHCISTPHMSDRMASSSS